MCQFCKFEYGVSKSTIRQRKLNKVFTWEIRHNNTTGRYMLVIKVFDEQIKDVIDKSVIFIQYCPMCGRKL